MPGGIFYRREGGTKQHPISPKKGCSKVGQLWRVPNPHVLIFAVGVECGENRGRTGGEAGENRGRPKEPGENRGHFGREPGENRGLLALIYKEYRGRSGGFGTRTGGEPGGGNFLWNKRPNSGPENQRTGPPVKISTPMVLTPLAAESSKSPLEVFAVLCVKAVSSLWKSLQIPVSFLLHTWQPLCDLNSHSWGRLFQLPGG